MKKIVVSVLLLSAVSFQLSAYADGGQASFAAVEKIFLEGRYEDVVRDAGQLISARSYRQDELYYLKGLSELKLNRFEAARQSFKAIISNSPSSARRFDAQVGIGDSYLLEGNTDMAIKSYENTMKLFPAHKNAPAVYYRLAEACAKGGDADKSKYYFDSAKLVAPLSFEAGHQPIVEHNRIGPADIPPQNIPAKISEKAAEKHVSIQVGSFKNKDNADKFAEKLSGQGFESHAEEGKTPEGTVYRIRVGKFATRDDARDTITRLKNRGYKIKICDDDICE